MARSKSSYVIAREPRIDLEDLRDDTIAVVLNSGMSFTKIEQEGGPTTTTLRKWLYKETKFPRLDTVRSILKICGYDFAVVPTQLGKAPSVVADFRPTTTQTLPVRKQRPTWRASVKRAQKGKA